MTLKGKVMYKYLNNSYIYIFKRNLKLEYFLLRFCIKSSRSKSTVKVCGQTTNASILVSKDVWCLSSFRLNVKSTKNKTQ